MEFIKLIEAEIRNAKKGNEAYIHAKMNNLVDEQVIRKLYDASRAGVKIRLIVRGICCLIPGLPGISENIEAISIIDKFLEHSRVFIFCQGNKPRYYMSSADWMTRNLDRRIEVAFPVYDADLQNEIRQMFDIQWRDNTKARILDKNQQNRFRDHTLPAIRSQFETYEYLKLTVDS